MDLQCDVHCFVTLSFCSLQLWYFVIFMQAWEGRAYDYGMENLKNMGFPVDDLEFDPDLVVL